MQDHLQALHSYCPLATINKTTLSFKNTHTLLSWTFCHMTTKGKKSMSF